MKLRAIAYSPNTISQTFTCASSDTSVATVNAYGAVTGVSPGTAVITGTSASGRTTQFTVVCDRYAYELVHSFGFDDKVAVLIRDLYNRVDRVFSNETGMERAWKCARLLSEFCYEKVKFGININDDVAGSVTDNNNRQQYFINTLGYSEQQYTLLNSKLTDQHTSATTNGVIDFCHMQYTLAARLAYYLDKDDIYSNIGTGYYTGHLMIYTDEEISYFGGWLGDAVLAGGSGNTGETTSLKNDDYTSDLDAENIYRMMLQGSLSVQVFSNYYTSLSNGSNRAVIFKTHISYETVRDMVFRELIPDSVSVQNYWLYLSSEYYDTYNFLHNLNDNRSTMANY